MFLVYDTETTGLPDNWNEPITNFANWPRLVQIAWQLHDDKGYLVEAQNHIIKPEGYDIPYNSEVIHGISTERAHNEGKDLREILELFNQKVEQCEYVVGQNIEFDINIVGCEFLRKEIDSDLTKKPTLDTKDDATEYCKLPGGRGGKYKYPSLSELHEKLFGEPVEDAHNAAADVEATARCFFELVRIEVIQREGIALAPDIKEHLEKVKEQILSSIDYKNEHAIPKKGGAKSVKIDVEKAKDIDAPFVHLHNHSHFSILQATSEINALIQKAKENGMPAVALTDAGNMFGGYKFVEGALAEGIKPIMGAEFNLCENHQDKSRKDNGYQVVLLAKNKVGYHNLAKLSSISYTEGMYYVPRIDKDLLVEYKEGIIALSGGVFGEIPSLILNVGEKQAEQAFDWWHREFGDDFYVELNRHGLEEEERVNAVLLKMANEKEVKVVATNNTYYLDKKDADAHDILICVKDGKLQEDPKKYIGRRGRDYRFGFPNDEFYFKSQDEMKALFADIPEAIENIQEIVKKVEEYRLASDVLLPAFKIPQEFVHPDDEKDNGKRGENNYLRHLTYVGAEERYGEITDEIRERLDFELATIERTGYPGYFLIVQDFIAEARKMGVSVGPGRGSAAGSAVAYCIKITNVDPIEYGLLFERFLNPDRISMPDIDIDFDDERRGLIIEWVVEKYGFSSVAQIVTYGTMAAKSAIRDTARVLNLPLPEADRLAKLIPDVSLTKLFGPKDALKSSLNSEGMAKAEELWRIAEGNDLAAKTVNQARILEGSVRNTGTHACGVIITPSPLTEHVPVAVQKDADLLITQFDNSVVESAGLLKMDFLGLKTLTIIRDAINIIKQRHGIDIIADDIPLTDEKTYELYQRGETNGTFQFESAGMQRYLKELKPDRFEDLIAMNALYRPGPLEYIPNFVARKHGKEEITYDTPEMEEFLKETYGITVYQEQVMLLSQKLAGFTKGEADALRKGMGKKKKSILDELKPKFVSGCNERNISTEIAEKIWRDWEAFAAYAFNKSHSTCYSVVAFHTAYLKANYPAEYMASVLTHNMHDIKKVTFFMEECRRMGIPVLGPDVNESSLKFTVNQKGEIRFGLGGVKGVGESAVDAIVEERENGQYQDFWDFAKRINLRAVNKKCFESLAYAGGFDCFGEFNRTQYVVADEGGNQTLIEKAIRYGQELKMVEANAMNSLFGDSAVDNVAVPKPADVDEWPLMIKLEKEKEVIGFYISGHPLDTYKYEIDCFCTINFRDLQELTAGQFSVAGIVTDASHRLSKKGTKFGVFTVEDYYGANEFWMFGEDYLKYQHLINEGEILYMKIQPEEDRFRPGNIRMRILDIMQMEDARKKVKRNLSIQLDLQKLEPDYITNLAQSIKQHPGEAQLLVSVIDAEQELSLPLRSKKFKVELNNDLLGFVMQNESIRFQLTKGR
ncbi:MAG: DNA polymerase III subunit alpha [Bacteroidetes bacterium]|nr:DNA polymerase III subunit alpha [Bacteroidota bacterium]